MTNEANDIQMSGAAEREEKDTYSHLPAEEQVVALRKDLEEARREASQNLDLAQRAQAELINYRRRTHDERVATEKYSNGRLIARLLPVMEELDLAISHAGNGGPNASWLEGIKLIQRKLMNLLESEGVAKIEAVGTMFNPLEHEALGSEETTRYLPGYVTQTFRSGYRLHDRVLQAAQVMVARAPENAAQANTTPDQNKETEYD